MLGEDEHGVWVGAEAGNRMYKGTDDIVHGGYRIVWCVPRNGWFLAHYLDGHAELDVYIDVASPAVWSPRGAKLIDLDFDVVVWNDGRAVELIDEDEFDAHRSSLGYPDDIIEAARMSAAQLLDKATAGEEPFTAGSAARWFDSLEVLARRAVAR